MAPGTISRSGPIFPVKKKKNGGLAMQHELDTSDVL